MDPIKEAIDDPDPDRLMDSGDPRIHSIDAKLGLALTKVVTDSNEEGNNVAAQGLHPHQRKGSPGIDSSQFQHNIQR